MLQIKKYVLNVVPICYCFNVIVFLGRAYTVLLTEIT